MSMRYFFEDNGDAALSRFFIQVYKDRDDVVFTQGDANLQYTVTEFLLAHHTNVAIVYLDLVPDNIELKRFYKNLKALSVQMDYRCIVIPIVCAEFYYTKHLLACDICKEGVVLASSILQRSYPSPAWLSKHSPKSYSNYEHLCKLFADRMAHSCARIPRTGKIKREHRYTIRDCLCGGCHKSDAILEQKALAYVKEFPYPPYSPLLGFRQATEEERWEAHRECVAEFNAWSDELSKSRPCFKIKPIR